MPLTSRQAARWVPDAGRGSATRTQCCSCFWHIYISTTQKKMESWAQLGSSCAADTVHIPAVSTGLGLQLLHSTHCAGGRSQGTALVSPQPGDTATACFGLRALGNCAWDFVVSFDSFMTAVLLAQVVPNPYYCCWRRNKSLLISFIYQKKKKKPSTKSYFLKQQRQKEQGDLRLRHLQDASPTRFEPQECCILHYHGSGTSFSKPLISVPEITPTTPREPWNREGARVQEEDVDQGDAGAAYLQVKQQPP